MKIGIIKEGKIPRDTRAALSPEQCKNILNQYPSIQIIVQPCSYRCFKDEEYSNLGIELSEDLASCDILLGIKEVPIPQLISGKTYLFFSHTIKKQMHNQKLLKALLEKKVRMVDYETLCNPKGERVLAFGKWAGIVGAHNAIWTYSKRTKKFTLPRMYQSFDFETVKKTYSDIVLGNVKIVLTGTGRVSSGAAEVLNAMRITRVDAHAFLHETFDGPVYTQLNSAQMYARKSDDGFDRNEFHQNPALYKSIFAPYTQVSDIMINGIYWNKEAPVFFSAEDMQNPAFKIKTIGDITCDVMPFSSIPSTLYATTINEPVFGYNPFTKEEEAPYSPHVIDMMTIDNLPNELPRDASVDFGNQLLSHVLKELLQPGSEMIDKATICQDGQLNEPYEYLRDYAFG